MMTAIYNVDSQELVSFSLLSFPRRFPSGIFYKAIYIFFMTSFLKILQILVLTYSLIMTAQ